MPVASPRSTILRPRTGRTPGDFRRPATGARPSPVAARFARTSADEFAWRPFAPHPAAPEDGRTPSFCRQAQALIRIPKPRAAPRPILRRRHQHRLRWVVFDVSPRFGLMLAVTHESVPITHLSKPSLASENFVRLLGGEGFPRIHQLRHRHVLYVEEQVGMVRPDHPGAQVVLHPVTK